MGPRKTKELTCRKGGVGEKKLKEGNSSAHDSSILSILQPGIQWEM